MTNKWLQIKLFDTYHRTNDEFQAVIMKFMRFDEPAYSGLFHARR